MKRILLALAVLSASALAQNAQQPTPPPYCQPCLFYGGDFDPTGANPNALGNSDTLFQQATTYVPFYVPTGQVWTIRGMFSNVASDVQYISPKEIQWSISRGVSAGNPGTLLGSGTASATWALTGRSWGGFQEYTALGRIAAEDAVTLTPGVYWMTAVPVCTNTDPKSICGIAAYSVTDVEDDPAPHRKGFEPNDDSYYTSEAAGLYFAPTWGTSGVCNGFGCDRFSVGLLGYAKPTNP
jgi:hypothetical protein